MTTGIPRKLEGAGRGPAPWAPRKARAGGRAGDSRSRPSPTACTPLPGRGSALPRRAGRSRAPRTPHHPPRPVPRGDRGFERCPRAEAAGGNLRYDTWGRRWTGQRRQRRLEAEARAEEEVPGTPPPIVPARPAARSGPLRPARVLPGARPRCRPLPCSGPLSPAANATYSRESSSGPRERTHRQKVKLRQQAGSGCWLVLSPSFLPTPSPRSPVRCPERWRLTSGA